jgi:hypothetical protein
VRVLDIDLDAFVHGTATYGAPKGQRLKESEFVPWGADQVISFLEQHCHLSKQSRRPGAVFEDHQEAFFYWQRLIAAGRLRIPFDVVHVDAHSDMSAEGSGAHIYVLTELLAQPLEERATKLDTTRVTFANYPVFAAALGWFRSFTWVRPPTGDDGILQYYVGDGSIHLKRYPVGTFAGTFDSWHRVDPIAEDEPVPASIFTTESYRAEGAFDFVTVCRSPQYTPASADALFPVVREYIDELEGRV